MARRIPLLQAAITAEEEKKRSLEATPPRFEEAILSAKSRERHGVSNTLQFSGGSKQRSLVSMDDTTTRLNYDDVVTLRTVDTDPHPQDKNHGQPVNLHPTMSTLSQYSISSDYLPIATDPSFSVQRSSPVLDKPTMLRKSPGRGVASNLNSTQLLPVPIPFSAPLPDDDKSHFSFFADKPRSPPEQSIHETSNRNYFGTKCNRDRGPKRSRPIDRSLRSIDFKSRVTEWRLCNVVSGDRQTETNNASVQHKTFSVANESPDRDTQGKDRSHMLSVGAKKGKRAKADPPATKTSPGDWFVEDDAF